MVCEGVQIQQRRIFHAHSLLLHHQRRLALLLLSLQLRFLGRHGGRVLRPLLRTLRTLLRLRLRWWLWSLLRLLHRRRLRLRQLLRRWIGRRLWLNTVTLLRRGLSRWRLRRIGLRCNAPLVRRRARLRLRSDAVCFVHTWRLCCSALRWVVLTGLARSTSVLGLLRLLSLLLSLLKGQKLLLLLRGHRLAMWHLLQSHLQIYRSHRRVSLHGCNLGWCQALCAIG